jgi:hypothetical protein
MSSTGGVDETQLQPYWENSSLSKIERLKRREKRQEYDPTGRGQRDYAHHTGPEGKVGEEFAVVMMILPSVEAQAEARSAAHLRICRRQG